MPGLDKMGRPVGYGDGRTPSLADKVRLLQQLVRERQAMPAGKKPPVAGIRRPNRTGGMMAPVDPSRMPRGPIYPGPGLPNGRRYR